jgi:hypothetical protein
VAGIADELRWAREHLSAPAAGPAIETATATATATEGIDA